MTAAAPLAAGTEPEPLRWSFPKLVAFRFAFVYFALYCLTETAMVFVQDGINPADKLWLPLVRWFAVHVLRLSTKMRPDAGSGDTTFNYVQVLVFVLLAALGTLIWSALDRPRSRNHPRLLEALRIGLRYTVFLSMLSYGLMKVIKVQFPDPTEPRLMETYGESSPMGLLWTFMGASTAYTFFAGAGELLGGILMVFRRTTLLGGLVTTAVMGNVVMLNFCYDVPVKLYSTHILLMAIVLVALDARPLLGLVGRPVAAKPEEPVLSSAGWRRSVRVLKSVVVLGAVAYQLYFTVSSYRLYGPSAARSPLAGGYVVEEWVKNGERQPLVATNAAVWRKVAIGEWLAVWHQDESGEGYGFTYDAGTSALTLRTRKEQSRLLVTHLDERHLALEGKLHGDDMHITLRKIDPKSWLLTHRGFHFVNEFPDNE